MDEVKALMRKTRLNLDKQTKSRKEQRRHEIVSEAKSTVDTAIAQAQSEFQGITLSVLYDFEGAIKGKRSFDKMISACNDEVARTKLAIAELCDQVRSNLALIDEQEEHGFLFVDTPDLVSMEPDHLKLLIKSRISDYEEERKKQEELERQQQEEEERKKQEELGGTPPKDSPSNIQPVEPDEEVDIQTRTHVEGKPEPEKFIFMQLRLRLPADQKNNLFDFFQSNQIQYKLDIEE
jgi:hypothetical protein